MVLDIPYQAGDDRSYLSGICGLVATVVRDRRPAQVYVTRVNKWFDHKWLRYSGKGRVAFHGAPWIDTALDPLWRDKLTFPPFNPKQVGHQLSWQRGSDGSYRTNDQMKRLHDTRLHSSARNLNNRVADFTNSGLFVWFTSDTEKNRRGSLLVYTVNGSEVSAWYSSFKRETGWVIDRVKGIDKSSVERWFPFKQAGQGQAKE